MSIIEISLYALIIAGLVLIGLYFSRGVEEHKNKLKLEELMSTIAPATIFFDSYGGRYFLADPSVIEQHIKKINEQLRSNFSTIEDESKIIGG